MYNEKVGAFHLANEITRRATVKTVRAYPIIVCFLIVSFALSGCQLSSLGGTGTSNTFQPSRVAAADCSYGGEIKSVEAVDQYTVRFTLCSADVAFPAKVASPVFSIQDQAYLTANQGDSNKLTQQTNGTGPYLVSDYVPGQRLVLEANPGYWGVPPKANRMVITWTGASDRYTALRFGTVDLIDNPALADYNAIKNDTNLKLSSRPLLNVLYVGFNVGIAPFDKLEVRQGIALGLDRSVVVNNSFTVGAETADQFVPNSVAPGYTNSLKWYDYNTGDALSKLKSASFDFSQPITLSYSTVSSDSNLPALHQVALNILRQLATIGINVVLNPMAPDDFQTSLQQGKLGFFLDYQTADYADAVAFYNNNFTGTTSKFGTPFPDLKTQIVSASKSSDSILRQQIYDVVNNLIKQYVPVIPIAHITGAFASRTSIENVVVGPFNENYPEMNSETNTLLMMQDTEPSSLWPADENNSDTLRIAGLLYDTLVRYEYGGTTVVPDLAISWSSSSDLTEWTFNLRYGVKFTNGATLDANDVVASFAAIWDAKDPNHKGRTGDFTVFQRFFGSFVNSK
jgi:peptide/nickel transport system substrate-binding protein